MSDGNTSGPDALIIGTAGHIDHGKTSLVRALTGMETDRLEEEKRRGISIDLGFANMTLPNGRTVSFIDVPGHERFVKNMLAGAAGIQAVLLVVAADESVKPQTREHFHICRMLGVRHGAIVLTKSDLATAEQIQATEADVKALVAGSFLAEAPTFVVSTRTREGFETLVAGLERLAQDMEPRAREGLARLPVDRSFAMKGFGTVVTGTLMNGSLGTGDVVRIHPSGKEARIRGLQTHRKQVERGTAGQRVAVNLAGVDHAEIVRGCTLTHKNALEATRLIDVALEWLDEREKPDVKQQMLLHLGTAEVCADVKAYPKPSGGRLARLVLAEPVLTLPGDRFVLRRPSPAETVAGGVVVDAFPPRRLNRARLVERLSKLTSASLSARVQLLVEESASGRKMRDLEKATGAGADELKGAIQKNSALLFVESIQRVVSRSWLEARRRQLLQWLGEYHKEHPAEAGAPMSAARLGLEPEIAALVFQMPEKLRVTGDTIALATHRPRLSGPDAQALEKIENSFRSAGLEPPRAKELLQAHGTDPAKMRGLLEALIKGQKLVRISEDLVFHADVLAHVRRSLAMRKGRKFTVPEFKEWTQVSRKYAIPLLEYFDRQRVTRREGDARVVL